MNFAPLLAISTANPAMPPNPSTAAINATDQRQLFLQNQIGGRGPAHNGRWVVRTDQ